MKVFYYELIISVLFSFQQNNHIYNIINNNKDDQKRLEEIQRGLKDLNFEKAVSNITNLFKDQIFSLTGKINDLINDTLNEQDQIIKDAESEQITIKEMLNEINLLKKRYRRNMIFSYIIGIIILVTFIYFYWTDHLNRRRTRKYAGYKNPVQSENENNQIDIE